MSSKPSSLVSAVYLTLFPMALVPVSALGANEATLNEVVVTARYREEKVQDVAASIRAYSEAELKQRGIDSIADLVRVTPSVAMQERGPNRNEISIRGVTRFLTNQDLLPTAVPVGTYLDDVPINTAGGSQIDVRFFDLNRVEVLRGPQGTLFGEGASGGAVRYFTRDPEFGRFGGQVEADLSTISHGGTDGGLRAAINFPIGDRAAVRFAGGRYGQAGYIDGSNGAEKNVNDFEALFARGVLKIEPTDDWRIRLMAQYDDSTAGSLGYVDEPVSAYRSRLPLGDDKIDDKTKLVSLSVGYDAGPITITSITSYWDRKRLRRTQELVNGLLLSFFTENPFGTGFPSDATTRERVAADQFSQELRFVSNFEGRFNFVAGAFYRKFNHKMTVLDIVSDTYRLIGYPFNSQSQILPTYGIDPFTTIDTTSKQASLFAEGSLDITDQLKLTLGVRYHDERLKSVTPPTGYIIPTFIPIFGLTPLATPEIRARSNVSRALPKVLVEFSPNDDMLLYAQYATGLRNGGTNSSATLGIVDAFFGPGASSGIAAYGPDRVRTFEGGFKSQWNEQRITLNAAAFISKYSDLQLLVLTPPLGFGAIVNVSKASMKGVELDFSASVTDSFRLFGGANYIDAATDAPFVPNQLSGVPLPAGARLPYVPKYSLSFGGQYEFRNVIGQTSLYLGLDGTYVGRYPSSISQPGDILGDYGLLNLSAGVKGDRWSLDLRVTNLTDENKITAQNYFDDVLPGLGFVVSPPGTSFNDNTATQPRTFRLTLRKEF